MFIRTWFMYPLAWPESDGMLGKTRLLKPFVYTMSDSCSAGSTLSAGSTDEGGGGDDELGDSSPGLVRSNTGYAGGRMRRPGTGGAEDEAGISAK